MAQHISIAPEQEIEIESTSQLADCRHHWVIQPADGPVSNGLCQACGETREFQNYVESATWGDRRISSKASSASSVESTSDDDDLNDQGVNEEPEPADEEVEVEV